MATSDVWPPIENGNTKAGCTRPTKKTPDKVTVDYIAIDNRELDPVYPRSDPPLTIVHSNDLVILSTDAN